MAVALADDFLTVHPKGFWLKELTEEERKTLGGYPKITSRLATPVQLRFNRKRINTIFSDFVHGYKLQAANRKKIVPLLFLVFSVPKEKDVLSVAFDFNEKTDEQIINTITSCTEMLEKGAKLEMIMYCDFKEHVDKKMIIFAAKDSANNTIHRCFRYYKKRSRINPLGEEVIHSSLSFWIPEKQPEVLFKPVRDEFLNGIRFT